MTARAGVIEWGSERARARPWRDDDRTAYLAPLPETQPPSRRFIDRCLQALAQQGFTAVVTAALAPSEQRPFLSAGFDECERLHLLAHDLLDIARPEARPGLRRPRRAEWEQVLAIDSATFRPFWRLDRVGLDEALAATPWSRFRVVADPGGAVVAYAVTGRAGANGYVQRLAVDPSCQRRGLGSALVLDGLHWMRRRGVAQALVNTQLDNQPALDLYRRLGFRLQGTGLAVLRRELRG